MQTNGSPPYNEGLTALYQQTTNEDPEWNTILQLPQSTQSAYYQILDLLIPNVNNPTGFVATSAAQDLTTGIYSNTDNQIRYYPDFDSAVTNNPAYLDTSIFSSGNNFAFTNYANYLDTFVAATPDGRFYSWDYESDIGSGSWGQLGDFSDDVGSYGDLVIVEPNNDGDGLFLGYRKGSLQYFNGVYTAYLDNPVFDQFDTTNYLYDIAVYDQQNAAINVMNYTVFEESGNYKRQWYSNLINFVESDEVTTVTLSNPLVIDDTTYETAIEGGSQKDKIIGTENPDLIWSGLGKNDIIRLNGSSNSMLYTMSDLVPNDGTERSSNSSRALLNQPGSHKIIDENKDIITNFKPNDDNLLISKHFFDNGDFDFITIKSNSKLRGALDIDGFESTIFYNEANGDLFLNVSSLQEEESAVWNFARLVGAPEINASYINIV